MRVPRPTLSTYTCTPCLSRIRRVRCLTTETQQSAVDQDVVFPVRLDSEESKTTLKDEHPNVGANESSTESSTSGLISLTKRQQHRIKVLNKLANTARVAASEGRRKSEEDKVGSSSNKSAADEILQADQVIRGHYRGVESDIVLQELDQISVHSTEENKTVTDGKIIQILQKLSLISDAQSSKANLPDASRRSKRRRTLRVPVSRAKKATAAASVRKIPASPAPSHRKVDSRSAAIAAPARRVASQASADKERAAKPTILDTDAQLDASAIVATPVELENEVHVPKLSFDLSRVLFNPGVYHLQDPRSRVYNFDPYLEKIMPVTEFNFNALNPYITSSKDTHAAKIMQRYRKKYRGSSSSLTGVMSHFHFLLSAWRPIDSSLLSKKMDGDMSNSFTIITKSPVSIYLRYQNGSYAVDADKEYDRPNILMMQGKSMEKLLTCEKHDFEKFRKPKVGDKAQPIDVEPEQYHYTTIGDFLLRSQLDAHDPRLPGTGMFDLKTRAVAGIRMNLDDHEKGMTYEIKNRFGAWESYDREYYDMIRSAFLKYSLQVRMGRMDGIFVAYHNITRIFGFQYISLEELDIALHGQPNQTLGDQEFKVTIKLLNEVFDEATRAFPEQSLKLVFETRNPSNSTPNGDMRIFAEPVDDKVIDERQESRSAQFDEYEQMMQDGIDPKTRMTNDSSMTLEKALSPSTLESSAPDEDFLNRILTEGVTKAPVAEKQNIKGWTLEIANSVNGQPCVRPEKLEEDDQWTVQYSLQAVASEHLVSERYKSAKLRREAALKFDPASRRDSYFMRALLKRCRDGKEFREERDIIDADKPKVVLYDNSVPAS